MTTTPTTANPANPEEIHGGGAFTLVELLVVVAVIAVLAGLLAPAAIRISEESRATKCSGFLRQLGTAAMLYAADHEMSLPVTVHQRRQGGVSWTRTLQEYASGTLTFRCPDDPHSTRAYSYVLNDFLTPNPAGAPDLDFSRLSRIERPSQTFVFAEADAGYANSDHFHFSEYAGRAVPAPVFAAQVAVERHGGSANYVFADGHMETLPWSDVRIRLETPGSRFVDPSATP